MGILESAKLTFLAFLAVGFAADARAYRQMQFLKVDGTRFELALNVLNERLKNVDPHAKIKRCSILISSHPGKVNTIYGGYCELVTGYEITLCADTGVGYFAITDGLLDREEDTAQFAAEHCHG